MTSPQEPAQRTVSRSKHLWIGLIGVACLLGLLSVAIRNAHPNEPSFEGRSLSSWLEDFSYDDTNAISQAEIAVRGMGTNAIPFLLDVLSYQESPARKKLRQFTEKLPAWLHFFDSDSNQSLQAAQAMNALGPVAEDAYPTLTNLFFNGKAVRAGIALAGIGQKGVLFLTNTMTNQAVQRNFHMTSALALGCSRSDFDIVVPALIQVLNTTNSDARKPAATSLGELRQKPEIAIPSLMRNLDDPDATLHSYVISALGKFGAEAKAAVPLLLQVRKDGDENVRERAEQALRKISPELVVGKEAK